MDTIPLRCACGAVTGQVLDAAAVFRIVCHCRGCQAFGRWLGRADELLDPVGGTDVYQLTPSQLRIEQGLDQVHAVRLTPKGAVRWHAACCRTPIANTLDSPKVAWLGVHHLFVDTAATGTPSRDDAIGPARWRIHGKAATGPAPDAHPSGPMSLIARALFVGVFDTVRGRARPHPFFDDGAPISAPVVLTDAERGELGL